MLAKLKGWRTMIWNAMLSAVPIGLAVTDYLRAADLSQLVTPGRAIALMCVVIAVNVALRLITRTPVGGDRC